MLFVFVVCGVNVYLGFIMTAFDNTKKKEKKNAFCPDGRN